MTTRFQALCLSFFLSATSCKPSQVATGENESETASVAPGESRSWNQHRKNLAIINNSGKAALACTTGAAFAALVLIGETVPLVGMGKLTDLDAMRRVLEFDEQNVIKTRPGFNTVAGGIPAAIADAVGNIINLLKMITIKDYTPPVWSRSWDNLTYIPRSNRVNLRLQPFKMSRLFI